MIVRNCVICGASFILKDIDLNQKCCSRKCIKKKARKDKKNKIKILENQLKAFGIEMDRIEQRINVQNERIQFLEDRS